MQKKLEYTSWTTTSLKDPVLSSYQKILVKAYFLHSIISLKDWLLHARDPTKKAAACTWFTTFYMNFTMTHLNILIDSSSFYLNFVAFFSSSEKQKQKAKKKKKKDM